MPLILIAFAAKVILSYMVIKKSPMEFRLNGLLGRLDECGFFEWFENMSWFTINIAAFLPRRKWMRYLNAHEQNPSFLKTGLFTWDHLLMAFIYYIGMLTVATFVFVIEVFPTEKWKKKYFIRPVRRLMHMLGQR